MVTVLKAEAAAAAGGTQLFSANVQKTIQSIKEIVRNHSDTEIYNTLRESNMDPNETAQKLLNQDPFHEVRRKRDKKKENAGYKDISDRRRQNDNPSNPSRFISAERNVRGVRRAGYIRNNIPARTDPGVSREFRVVRDNRVNQNSDKDCQSASVFSDHSPTTNAHEKRKEHNEIQMSPALASASQPQTSKLSSSQSEPPRPASSGSSVGVYASASDPVHVPSPDSKSPAGPIKRDVGIVGVRKQSTQPISSHPNPVQGSANVKSFQPASTIQKNDMVGNSRVNETIMLNTNRTFFDQHHSSRPQQQPIGHQKGALPSKEWKPKASQKLIVLDPGVIGTPLKSASPADDSKKKLMNINQLQDKLKQVAIHDHEAQNVIIAQHIRVPENDRCQLTFGSFGMELDSSGDSGLVFKSIGITESSGTSTSDNGSGSKLDDQVRNSDSVTTSDMTSDKKESLSSHNMDGYVDAAVVRENSSSFEASEAQNPPELPNFPVYDPQTGYAVPHFRPSMDDDVRAQQPPSQEEALASHSANSIPDSSIAMLHQPQAVAQMYSQQVHLSHFANVIPYRQFLSPVYAPHVGLPGYSNPATSYTHPHPTNGSGYVFMPGGTSPHHLAPNGSMKYGVQQFKPIAGSSAPTAFGNYGGAPAGFAINGPPPGVVGGMTGLEDSSRLKYKDNNLYVPNPQAETSEVWIQNPRDIPGMQSASYYNMQGQTTHPAAFMHGHAAGHASFNPSQSSHMHFPGVYHAPPQPAPIAGLHHLAGPMGGNVGVGVGPAGTGASQIGAYQQAPQLGHMNWTTNF